MPTPSATTIDRLEEIYAGTTDLTLGYTLTEYLPDALILSIPAFPFIPYS